MTKEYIKRQFSNFYNDVVKGKFAKSEDVYKEYISQLTLDKALITFDGTSVGYSTDPWKTYTQGMCTDGTYLYVIVMDSNSTHNTVIAKYLMADGTLVDMEYSYSLGHGNSLTYNPNDDKIYCVALDDLGTIHKINTDLSYDSSFTVDLSGVYSAFEGIRAIDYNVDREQFVCVLKGSRNPFAIFDKDFNLENLVWTQKLKGTLGAMTTDRNFIYEITYKPNTISIFGWNGKYITSITMPSMDDKKEPEEMVINGSNVYVNFTQNINTDVIVKVAKYSISNMAQGF
jgi:hypothetical protein